MRHTEQFVKALPNGEIELHGDDETYQCNAGEITKMHIHFVDGMEFKCIGGECKRIQTEPARYILVVIMGYDTREHYADRITFATPTEAEAEAFREQINKIRNTPRSVPMSMLEKVKSAFKVRS